MISHVVNQSHLGARTGLSKLADQSVDRQQKPVELLGEVLITPAGRFCVETIVKWTMRPSIVPEMLDVAHGPASPQPKPVPPIPDGVVNSVIWKNVPGVFPKS